MLYKIKLSSSGCIFFMIKKNRVMSMKTTVDEIIASVDPVQGAGCIVIFGTLCLIAIVCYPHVCLFHNFRTLEENQATI